MKKLFKFEWKGGRGYDVEGIFITEQLEVDRIIGCEVYFGEICGKHSEVFGDVGEKDITMLSDDPSVIEVLLKVFPDGKISGYNPIEYYDDNNEDQQ